MRCKFCNNTVKETREALSLTQVELAWRVGTTQNTICSIEHGQVPSVALAIEIARVLKRPVTEIFIV